MDSDFFVLGLFFKEFIDNLFGNMKPVLLRLIPVLRNKS